MLIVTRRKNSILANFSETGKTVSLLFNDNSKPWLDSSPVGRTFTKVGTSASVDGGDMLNSAGSGQYITTPSADDLKLVGDFTLTVDIKGWVSGIGHTSLFQKGTPANGTAQVGQFFLYSNTYLFATSDHGSGYYDVFSSLNISNTGNFVLTIVRDGNTLYVYNNKTLCGSTNVAGKTFGNNTFPLNVNGGNLTYSLGFPNRLGRWELTNGEAIHPT